MPTSQYDDWSNSCVVSSQQEIFLLSVKLRSVGETVNNDPMDIDIW